MDAGQCDSPTTFDVWHSLKRIRAATYRVGFNFWDIFRDLEPPNKAVTAEHKFLSVLCGPLKSIIGISDDEISNVAAFFRTSDGRINYEQFCRTIHDGGPVIQSEQEREVIDPYSTNTVTPEEQRNIELILTKIATTCEKPIILRPYFQEYELIKKGGGLVSRAGFFKVLSFLGIVMSTREHDLMVKKYGRDTHTMKYAAFLKDLFQVKEYLQSHGMLDTSGKLIPIYNTPFARVDLTVLPRPELHKELDMNEIGVKKIFSKTGGVPCPDLALAAIEKIKSHIVKEQIQLCDYFQRCDDMNIGRVPEMVFRQGLEWLRYSRKYLADMYLSVPEIKLLCYLYRDPVDHERILWHAFVNDVTEGIDKDEMASWPPTPLEYPPIDVIDRLPKIPQGPPEDSAAPREEFLKRFHQKVIERKAELAKLLPSLDRERTGKMSIMDFSKALKRYHFLLTVEELNHFKDKYGVGGEFIDYWAVIKDYPWNVQTTKIGFGVEIDEEKQIKQKEEELKEEIYRQENIVEVLAKIKQLIICLRIRLNEIMRVYDPGSTGLMQWKQFITILEECKIHLTDREKKTVNYVFHKQGDPCTIEYLLFCRSVDEESIMPCLSRLPLHEAMKQEKEKVLKEPHQFINFEERIKISQAIKKLSRFVNLGSIDKFKAVDKNNTGLVDKSTFLHLLYSMNVLHLISIREVDAIMLGLGYEKDNVLYLDYQDFLNALDIVFRIEKAALRL